MDAKIVKMSIIRLIRFSVRFSGAWRVVYWRLRQLPESRRVPLWTKLLRHGIVARFPDKGFWIVNTFVHTGEQYKFPGKGGGIYSAINWQRIHWRSDLPSRCTDKLAVRSYVRERVGADFLIPMLPEEGVSWTNPDDIDFSALPERFVLKLNNGSGMNLIVKDKRLLDIRETKAILREWLASDFSTINRERQYESIANRIYCETFLETPDGNPPDDFKIMCNNGRPLFVWVDTGRHVNHQRSFFDLGFRKIDVRVAHDNIAHAIPKPKNFDKMLAIASALSKDIPIVRIDLYNIDGKIYFGEMTFTSAAGMERYEPLSFSLEMAAQIDLSPFGGWR